MHKLRMYISGHLATGQTLDLDIERSHRLRHVMRVRNDQTLNLFDNDGNEHRALVIDVQRHSVRVEVGEALNTDHESPLSLTLALAITKPRSLDLSLQKAVELGVQRCVLLYSEYSPIRYAQDTWKTRNRHWQQIIINATEQCGRNRLCTLQPPQDFSSWLRATGPDNAEKIMAHPGSTASPPPVPTGQSIILIVGPEGGFSDDELALAESNHCTILSLGPRILRSETAVITALGICQALYGDWQLREALGTSD